MEIEHCSKADYDQIVGQIVDFWGSDRTLGLHHPMFGGGQWGQVLSGCCRNREFFRAV